MKITPSFTGLFNILALSPEMRKRVSAASVMVFSLLLVGWSLTIRLSLVTEAQSQIHTPFTLSQQVESLKQLWSEEEANMLHEEWATLQSQSFEHYDHLMTWVTRKSERAQELGLSVSYRVEEDSSSIEGVPEIHRIGMDWTIQSDHPESSYFSFMRLLRELSEDHLKVNIDAIEITGSGRGAEKMDLRLSAFLQQAT